MKKILFYIGLVAFLQTNAQTIIQQEDFNSSPTIFTASNLDANNPDCGASGLSVGWQGKRI